MLKEVSNMSNKLMAATCIEHLIRHEKAVADLYRLCASRLMDDTEFWNALAAHKEWRVEVLLFLKQGVMAGEIEFIPSRLNISAIATSLEYVNKMSKAVGGKDLTLEKALNIAMIVESKTAEKYAFDSFNWDTPNMKGVHETLLTEVNSHLRLVTQHHNDICAHDPGSWLHRLLAASGLARQAKPAHKTMPCQLANSMNNDATDTLGSLRAMATR